MALKLALGLTGQGKDVLRKQGGAQRAKDLRTSTMDAVGCCLANPCLTNHFILPFCDYEQNLSYINCDFLNCITLAEYITFLKNSQQFSFYCG